MVICLRHTAHQLNTDIRNLVVVLTKKGGRISTHALCLIYKFLASLKQIKLCPRDFIFTIRQEDICDYNPRCLMLSGLMLDDIIMNLFTDFTQKKRFSEEGFIFQNSGWYNLLVQRISAGLFTEKRIDDIKKILRSRNFIEK